MHSGKKSSACVRGLGSLVLLLAAMLAILVATPVAHAEDGEQTLQGIIDSRPEIAIADVWVIDQEIFVVNGLTELLGDLAVGDCVEIDYVEAEGLLIALTITAVDNCIDDALELIDLIEALPDGAAAGVWVIGDLNLTVDENTVLDGDLAVGVCVEVEYVEVAGVLLALKITVSDNCVDEKLETSGLIESLPDGAAAGVWVIGDLSITVNDLTVLDGELAVGVCVEVEYVEVAGVLLALKITVSDNCADEMLETSGLIESLPDGAGVGVWVIGDLSITVDENTVLEGDLKAGVCVEVEYTKTDNGSVALKIIVSDDCEQNEKDEPEQTLKLHDVVDALPDGAAAGVWVIGDLTITVDKNTVLEGDLKAGVCVKVEYTKTDNGPVALKIIVSDDCEQNEKDKPEQTLKLHDVVDALPDGAAAGVWVIGDLNITVDENTVLEGDLKAGACVEVKYIETDNGLLALKIIVSDDCEQKEEDKPSDDELKDDELKDGEPKDDEPKEDERDKEEHNGQTLFGRIDALPEQEGSQFWVIDGVQYEQNVETELETDYGEFAIGACVEFEVDEQNATLLVEVETTRDHKCKDENEEHPEGVIFGVVESAPDGLSGEWTVGGTVFIADGNTQFKLEKGPAVAGVTVKVKFYIDDNGANRALEIQTMYQQEKEEDNNGDGFRQGVEGKVYGIIEVLPDGLLGEWQISGVTYLVVAETELEQDDGLFAVGAKVKIEYVTTAGGARVAIEIETTKNAGGVKSDTEFKLIGFVDAAPETGFNGEWIISGASFTGSNATIYVESNGLLVVGAYVQVTYEIADNMRKIIRIATEVPPGAGDIDDTGTLENVSGADLSAVAEQEASAVWRIDGKDYIVSPATHLNDASGELTVGNTVAVNAYEDEDGNAHATSIQGLHLNLNIHLPFLSR